MGRQRSVAQIARDRRNIADLYLQGWLQADIAKKVKINQSTVSRDLKALHKEWLKDSRLDFDKAKAREIAKIDNLEREYHAAWIRSQKDKEASVTEKVEGKEARSRAQFRKEGQVGNPRFLEGVQWCIEKRCKIFGIDSATKVELGGTLAIQSSGSLTIYEYSNESDPDGSA